MAVLDFGTAPLDARGSGDRISDVGLEVDGRVGVVAE